MVSPVIDRFLLSTGSGVKVPCRVATTANITLSGLQTIDGLTLIANDRVLVKDQTDATKNGLYSVQETAWVRSVDFNDNNEVINGVLVSVWAGDTNEGIWQVTYTGTLNFGTTEFNFARVVASIPLMTTEYTRGFLTAADAPAARSTLGLGGASLLSVGNLVSDVAPGSGSTVYAPLASPALTGTPTAPTPSPLDNSTNVATTAYVEAAVASQMQQVDTFIATHELGAGNSGGTATGATWNTRPINTVIVNDITGASLSSNQVTLPAGTYEVEASGPAYNCGRHKLRWRNITDSTVDIVGDSNFAALGAANTGGKALLKGRVTIAGTKVFELDHYVESGQAGNGLGVSAGTGDGENEVYTIVQIWKVS